MGLGGCYSIIKYLLIVFNFIFWLVGVAAVVIAIWMFLDPTFYVSMVQDQNDYIYSTCILLVAGILLVIVGFMGCCGSFKESNCLLLSFFSLLLIVVVAEIAAGIWAYLNKDTLALHVKNAMKLTVEEEYAKMENRRLLFDTFQQQLHCCGAEKPTDWGGKRDMSVNVGITAGANLYDIPKSCCREGISADQCYSATHNLKIGNKLDYSRIYEDGCYSKVIGAMRDHFGCIAAIVITLLVIQVLGLLFALILAFAINRSGRYKA